MPKLSKSIQVRHSPEDMYALVRDVRSYPRFIKWIQTLTVRNERTQNGLYKCTGTALVGFRGIVETFATDIVGNPEICQIDVNLARGPFRHLRNQWRFIKNDKGSTDIQFYIDYEFRNPILRMLARSNTDLAVEKIMAAFSAEADRRYAKA
ncbi:MAG: type II toxin-antitoxin system RatA family toxin [Pseudomonadota bacterium]